MYDSTTRAVKLQAIRNVQIEHLENSCSNVNAHGQPVEKDYPQLTPPFIEVQTMAYMKSVYF